MTLVEVCGGQRSLAFELTTADNYGNGHSNSGDDSDNAGDDDSSVQFSLFTPVYNIDTVYSNVGIK